MRVMYKIRRGKNIFWNQKTFTECFVTQVNSEYYSKFMHNVYSPVYTINITNIKVNLLEIL
jgi:hypothetical protein